MKRKSWNYMVLHADLCVRSMEAVLDCYCNKPGLCLVDEAINCGLLIQCLPSGMYGGARLV